MMRSLTTGLGILAILAVTGAMTLTGQAMLGFRPATQTDPAVTVIADTAPPAPKKVAASPRVATPATAPAVVQPPAARPVAASTPAPATQQAPAAHSASASPAPAASTRSPQPAAQGGLGQVANVANILLNLPQVLSQTQVRPAPGNEEHESSRETQWVPNRVPLEKGRSHRKVEDGDDH